MKKRVAGILAAVMVVFSSVLPVMASEEPVLQAVESDALGSITVKLEDTSGNRPKDGVTIGIVQVADVVDGEFVLKEDYEGINVDLNKLYTANELEDAAQELQKAVRLADEEVVTDNSGAAEIKNLGVGVYLLYPIDIAGYEDIAASLVSIPTFNSEDGTMLYDIALFPKHSPIPETPKTGDFSNIWLYGSMAGVSLASAIGLAVKRRNRIG